MSLYNPSVTPLYSLNGVRPRRPEQFRHGAVQRVTDLSVSMESGLEGRNNISSSASS